MTKELYRVKCKYCNSTVAFKDGKGMEVKCDNCGNKNILDEQLQLELVHPKTIQHLK